jgi:hypothetical protein
MTNGIIEVDGTVEVGSEFVRRATHVPDDDARAAGWKARGCSGDRTFLKVTAINFGTFLYKMGQPKSGPARWIEDATRTSAEVPANESIDRVADFLRR